MEPDGTVDLWWIPLGSGAHVVRLSGQLYEAIVARRQSRRPAALYHAALTVALDGRRVAIEVAPEPDADGAARGAVARGAVGTAAAACFRPFRYEVRCCPDGVIPDLGDSVDSPVRLGVDRERATRLVALAPTVPTHVWGRDPLRCGDMWSSNSVVSWLLACAGYDVDGLGPPAGGRAPGWRSGLVEAARATDPPAGRRPPARRARLRCAPWRGPSRSGSTASTWRWPTAGSSPT